MVKSLRKHKIEAEKMGWEALSDKIIELELLLQETASIAKQIQTIDIIEIYEDKKKELLTSMYRYYHKTYPLYGEDFVSSEDWSAFY